MKRITKIEENMLLEKRKLRVAAYCRVSTARDRYYSINQLETMLFINRLKAYHFSLEEIKAILESEEAMDDKLYAALSKKKKEISMQMMMYKNMLEQIDADMSAIRKGKSIMCATLGLANTGDEYKLISELFTYKFLNDKLQREYERVHDEYEDYEEFIGFVADDMARIPADCIIFLKAIFLRTLYIETRLREVRLIIYTREIWTILKLSFRIFQCKKK